MEKKKKLVLNKNTAKNLKVKSEIKTGADTLSCTTNIFGSKPTITINSGASISSSTGYVSRDSCPTR